MYIIQSSSFFEHTSDAVGKISATLSDDTIFFSLSLSEFLIDRTFSVFCCCFFLLQSIHQTTVEQHTLIVTLLVVACKIEDIIYEDNALFVKKKACWFVCLCVSYAWLTVCWDRSLWPLQTIWMNLGLFSNLCHTSFARCCAIIFVWNAPDAIDDNTGRAIFFSSGLFFALVSRFSTLCFFFFFFYSPCPIFSSLSLFFVLCVFVTESYVGFCLFSQPKV